MRDGWKNSWGWRISAVVLVGGVLALGTGTVVTQASEFEGANNTHQNPFQRILHKLDKILDAIKTGGGSEGNHTLRWDQVLPAAQRFVVLAAFNNEAVLDKETGLVWEKTVQTGVDTWQNARHTCADKQVGGRKGWRLPSVAELASLVDPSVPHDRPSLPPGHPFLDVRPAIYWSASADAVLPTHVWGVLITDGGMLSFLKSGSEHAWCVRGPMQESTY